MVMRRIREALGGSSIQRCPDCDSVIPFESVNIKEGVAACEVCRKVFKLSELNWSHRSREEILTEIPSGCSAVSWGQSLVLIASMRSIPSFLGLLGASLFWNGINSVFLSIALAGLWANLIGPIPAWLPIPGGLRGGKPVMNDEPMSLGSTLFLCMFLIPFVVIGIGLITMTMINLVGRVKVVVDQMDSHVSTGIGFLSWKKRFDAANIENVRMIRTQADADSPFTAEIALMGDRTLKFGSGLPAERREWLGAKLQEVFSSNHKDTATHRGAHRSH
jgi:hypothetical protein